MNLVDRAQRQIAGILQNLEAETGQLVKGIDIDNIEITQLHHEAPQWHRRVVVGLEPIPGSNWETWHAGQ